MSGKLVELTSVSVLERNYNFYDSEDSDGSPLSLGTDQFSEIDIRMGNFFNSIIWNNEYYDDIFMSLKEMENKRRKICFMSPQIDRRPQLVALIKLASEKLFLSKSTVHLAVFILDCFMDGYKVTPSKLDVLALSCLLLASKMEERDRNIPKMMHLSAIGNISSCKTEFKRVETKILSYFDWNLFFPTSATFVESYACKVICVEDYNIFTNYRSNNRKYDNYDDMFIAASTLVFDFLDITLLDCRLVNYKPSKMSAACLAAARMTLKITPVWNERLCNLTGYDWNSIDKCADALISLRLSIEKQKRLKDTPDSGFLSEYTSGSETDDTDSYTSYTVPTKRRKLLP